jgi:hypothetical protein
MATNCSCSSTDYHNFTWLWFAYFKKPKVCCVAGVAKTIKFMSNKTRYNTAGNTVEKDKLL